MKGFPFLSRLARSRLALRAQARTFSNLTHRRADPSLFTWIPEDDSAFSVEYVNFLTSPTMTADTFLQWGVFILTDTGKVDSTIFEGDAVITSNIINGVENKFRKA